MLSLVVRPEMSKKIIPHIPIKKVGQDGEYQHFFLKKIFYVPVFCETEILCVFTIFLPENLENSKSNLPKTKPAQPT